MRPRDAATLLRQAPQTIPFAVRLEVFRLLIAADKQRGKWSLAPAYGGPRPIAFAVQRGRAVECGMRSLSGFGVGVKGPLSITYIDAHGRQVGVDQTHTQFEKATGQHRKQALTMEGCSRNF